MAHGQPQLWARWWHRFASRHPGRRRCEGVITPRRPMLEVLEDRTTPALLPPLAIEDAALTAESTPVAIDVLANDIEQDSRLDPSSLAITAGPTRGTASVQETAPGAFAILYIPDANAAASTLVVDDPSDVDDGVYSPGRLSLREAVRLANADHYTDVLSYTVRDEAGTWSDPATVTIEVTAGPTTITFAPGLTTLTLGQASDGLESSSALAITSAITIRGPAGAGGVTLAGPGDTADLRLFLVPAGGALTLEDLTLTNWVSDDSGGVLNVLGGGTATLTGCTLADNAAFFRGGAIHNFGTVTLTDTILSGNTAGTLGGGFYNGGTMTVIDCTLSANHADRGGGFYADWSSVGTSLTGSSLLNNSATDRGGGFDSHGNTDLTDCTISGNSSYNGGGFYNYSSAVLTNCTLTANLATFGGGFTNASEVDWVKLNGPALTGGTATLTDCLLTSNSARLGGGVYNSARAVLTDCTLSDNHADQGGGLFLTSPTGRRRDDYYASDILLTTCTLTGNSAGQGGGIFVDLGTMTLTASTLSGNTATVGGGIFNNSWATLVNSTLAGNTAATGGGLHNEFGRATLTSCTVADNDGGGIYNRYNTATLIGTLVANNWKNAAPSDVGGPTPVDRAHSVSNLIGVGGSGGLRNGRNGNRVGVDPLLAPLGAWGGPVPTFALLPGSPALDAGGGTSADARGVAAIGRRDVGAFESHGFTLTVADGSGQTAPTPLAFARPLTVLVTARDPAEPVSGGVVAFRAPAFGPSAVLSTVRPPIDDTGTASVTATANRLAGTYIVKAIVSAAAPVARFVLHNRLYRTAPLFGRPAAITVQPLPPAVPPPPAPAPVEDEPPAVVATVVARNRDRYTLDANYVLTRTIAGTGRRVVVDRMVQSLVRGPDGTLYKLGGMERGLYWVGMGLDTPLTHSPLPRELSNDAQQGLAGTSGPPYLLWRLGAGAVWQLALFARVRSFAVAPDRTLYVLTGDNQLCRLLPRSTTWSVLADDVQSFALASDGTVYELNGSHELKRLIGRDGWTTLDTGVQSFALAPDHPLYWLNDRRELTRLVGHDDRTILDAGVQSFALTPEGTVFELNRSGELWQVDGDTWSLLQAGVDSFRMAPDGSLFYLVGSPGLLVAQQRLQENGAVRIVVSKLDHDVQSFVMSEDGDVFWLNDRQQLRVLQGQRSITLDVGVVAFAVAPYGDVYWQNDHDELKRYRDGYFYQTDGTLVDFFAMTPEGTVYTARPSYWGSWFWSPDPMPVLPPIGAIPPITNDWPSEALILAAAGISAPDGLVVMTELLVDSIDPPRFFPRVGLAQMHHAIWKCTLYFTALDGPKVQVITIDMDHLHLFVNDSAPAGSAGIVGGTDAVPPDGGPLPTRATTGWIGEPLPGNYTGHALTAAPDGTLYRFGQEGDGYHWLGPTRLPRLLWQLRPGSSWQPATTIGVFDYAVAADSTLYVLDANRDLRQLVSGADWVTLATGVQSFALATDGTLWTVDAAQELQRLLPGDSAWSVVAGAVQSFTIAPDGSLYEHNAAGELRRLVGADDWTTIDTGVQSMWAARDGTLYELNGAGELRRRRGGSWTTLDTGVQAFATDFQGTIYVLDDQHRLKRLTARDHWVAFATGVQAFVVAPSPFNSVYVLDDSGRLKRLEAGYSWHTLQDGVVSLTIDRDGTVAASDDREQVWRYWSMTPAPFLPPIRADGPPSIIEHLPDEATILRVAHLPSGPDVQIVTELLLDQIDPPRYDAPFGPNQLHHGHFKSTIYYTDANGPQTQVVLIDTDHLHPAILEPPMP